MGDDSRILEQLHEIEKSIDIMSVDLRTELIELRRQSRRIADALELIALGGAQTQSPHNWSARNDQLTARIAKRGQFTKKRAKRL